MRIFTVAFLLCFAVPAGTAGRESPGSAGIGEQLRGINRIVFLGDSITQAGDYVTDIECWLLAHGLRIEVLNLGLGSETVTDLLPEENAGHLSQHGFGRPFVSERLVRVLAATKPDLLVACYGMNDGSSLPTDASGTDRFAAAIAQLRKAAFEAGVKRIVLCTPPVNDRSPQGEGNLVRYTEWLLAQRAGGWDVVDVHTPMRLALTEKRRADPAFKFAADGIHPGREGHWLMAREILTQYFGARLDGIASADALFPAEGEIIRDRVHQRMQVRFRAWMTRIGHGRPRVAGGPNAPPGPSFADAERQAADLTRELERLLRKAAPDARGRLTGFSWDRVPLYLHLGQRQGVLTDAELDFIAGHTSVVTLEKGHGARVHGSTERGITATALELKKRNPSIKVLFYLNTFINWPGYDALAKFDPAWLLRDSTGQLVTHTSGTPRPDVSLPAMREWWIDTVVGTVEQGGLDGVFADALPQVLHPSLAKSVGPEKAAALVAGMRDLLATVKAQLGPDKIVLANGTRTTDFREILRWDGIDGIMIEHFDAIRTRTPANQKADLETMALAAAAGKFTILKGWPGFTWLDREKMAKPRAELIAESRAQIGYPLACFLVAAHHGDFFSYSWGYEASTGMLVDYPELSNALGPPLGDATWDGLKAERIFAHASVRVDLETRDYAIAWRSPLPETTRP